MASKDANKTKVTNGEGKKTTVAKEKASTAADDSPAEKKMKQLEEQLVASIGFSLDDMMCVDEYDEAEEEAKKSRTSEHRTNRSSSSKHQPSSSSSHRAFHHSYSSSYSSSKRPTKPQTSLKKTTNKPLSQPKTTAASSSRSGGQKKELEETDKSKPVASKERGTPLKLSKLVRDHVKVKPEGSADAKEENSTSSAVVGKSEALPTTDDAGQVVVKSEQSPRVVECKVELENVGEADGGGGVASQATAVENGSDQKGNELMAEAADDSNILELAPDSDELDYNETATIDSKSEAGAALSETTSETAKAAPKRTTAKAPKKNESKSDQEKNKSNALSRKSSSELQPKRSEPDPKIAAYVQSLIKLEFDVKKYTCFYCNPCHAFLTTTAQWEEHLSTPVHRTLVCRWRECLDLFTESCHDGTSKLQAEIDNYSDVVVGAHKLIEIRNPTGDAHTWVCAMCVGVCSNVDQLLSHLSSFEHIDNFMEHADPGLYRPPGRLDQVDKHRRVPSSDQKRSIIEEARQLMDRQGRGRLRIYTGQRFQEWPEEQPETEELEEQLVMDKMELLFAENHSADEFPLKYDIIPSRRSIANHDFDRMKGESGKSMIGMQYMLEIWAPSRRVTPIYYCILCDYLVTNWTVHCTILKHCVCYLIKHYHSVYECVLFESSAEDEFRRALTMARDKVLMLEGRSMRVEHVIQLHGKHDDVFVPINATIAKRIVIEAKLEVPDPVRAKKSTVVAKLPVVTKSVPGKGAKVGAVSKPRPSDSLRNSKGVAAQIASAKRPSAATELRAADRDPKRHRPDASRPVRKDSSGSRSHRPSSPSPSPRDKKLDEKRRPPVADETRSDRRSAPDNSQKRRSAAPIKSTTTMTAVRPTKPGPRPHSPPDRRPREHHNDRSSRPPTKSGAWLNSDGPMAHKSLRGAQSAYAADHHRKGSSQQSHSAAADRDRHHHRHDERSRNESSGLSSRKRHRPHLSTQNLADLEKLLASIGFTVGHRLTERDLDQLEDQFGPKAIDELCTKVLGAPQSGGGGDDRRFDDRRGGMGRGEEDRAVAQQLALLEMGVGGAVDANQFVPGMLMPAMIPGMMQMGAVNPNVSSMLGVMPMGEHMRRAWPSNY